MLAQAQCHQRQLAVLYLDLDHQRRVAEDVRQALADSGLDPHGLELELTESILL